jgi:dTDP-4-dehydrorhamnose 3,5-epimerase
VEFIINSNSQKLILIPPNMGNAYYVISTDAVYHYKLAYDGEYIDADEQFSLSWNDESIDVKWLADEPILSNRDAKKNAK